MLRNQDPVFQSKVGCKRHVNNSGRRRGWQKIIVSFLGKLPRKSSAWMGDMPRLVLEMGNFDSAHTEIHLFFIAPPGIKFNSFPKSLRGYSRKLFDWR